MADLVTTGWHAPVADQFAGAALALPFSAMAVIVIGLGLDLAEGAWLILVGGAIQYVAGLAAAGWITRRRG